jgi:hypothetical protein
METLRTIPQLLKTIYGKNIDNNFILEPNLILDWEMKLNRFYFEDYILHIVSLEHDIIYKEVTDRGKQNNAFLMGEEDDKLLGELFEFTTLKSAVDSVLLKKINLRHEEVYGEKIHLLEFERSKRHYYKYLLGFACGSAGSPPELGMKALKLVKENSTEELTNWLQSNHAPMKGYGFVAFKALEAKGYQIPESIGKMMEHIQNSSMETGVCSGCQPTLGKFPLSQELNREWNIQRFIHLADCRID